MKAHFDAVYSEWAGHVALSAALPRLYMGEAPDAPKPPMPYGVFWTVTEAPEMTFANNYDGAVFQFDAYTNEWNADAIMEIDTQLKDCFHRTALTVAAHNHIVMLLQLTEGPNREDDCWHLVQQYYSEVQW